MNNCRSCITNMKVLLSRILLYRFYFYKYKVMESVQTLQYIKEKECSFVRFGDGEFNLLKSERARIGYQDGSMELQKALRQVLNYSSSDFLKCIPVQLSLNFKNQNAESSFFWVRYLSKNFASLSKFLDRNYLYGNTQISRPNMDLKSKDEAKAVFRCFRDLWTNKQVVVVEGECTRFGVGNNLLDNAESVERVLVPSENAFCVYDEILTTLINDYKEKDKIFLLAIGPTAKVLALDLHKNGMRVFDVGHLDIEYEWYIRGYDKKCLIPGKYVNEVGRGTNFVEDESFSGSKYHSEIKKIIQNTN